MQINLFISFTPLNLKFNNIGIIFKTLFFINSQSKIKQHLKTEF